VALLAGPAAATEEKKPDDGTAEKSAAAEKSTPEEKKGQPGEDAPPLRFTDEDLTKYKRPSGTEDPEAQAEDSPVVTPRVPAPRAPVKIAPPPSEDPLKPFRDREAKEAFRAEQLRTVRERIQ
jgi:hypothetical protein